jgi:hypothetical protein
MSNPQASAGAENSGAQPTQPFWTAPGTAGPEPAGFGPHGPAGPAGSQPPNFGEHPPKDRRRAFRWTAGIVVAALLAGGGVIAALSLSGHSSPGGTSAQAGQASLADSAQQAALLNRTLNSANSPGAISGAGGALSASGAALAASGSPAGAAARGAARALCARALQVAKAAKQDGLPRLARRIEIGATRCRLARRRIFRFFLLRGVDGQFTIQTRQGTKTLAFERGVIQAINAGKSLVVKAPDGTTWTWDIVSTTVVRDQQGKVGQGSLSVGATVWVGGPVVQGAKDARLIVLRPPAPSSVSPSPPPGN